MEETDLREILPMFLRRWWILAVCTLAFAIAAGLWSYYYIVPVYDAYTTLYVGKNVEQNGVLAGDLYLGSALIMDYREIAKSKQVASAVIKELGLLHMSADYMAGKIGVTQRSDTRVIQITVSDTSPKMAMDITNMVAEVFQKKVTEIMQIENVQIIDKAELPKSPVSPNKRRNVLIASIIGLAVGTGIIFLINFFDNTIKTPDDIKKYLHLPVIGTIPVFTNK